MITNPFANFHPAFHNTFHRLLLSNLSDVFRFHQNSTICHLFFAFHIQLLHLFRNNNKYLQRITSLLYKFHLAFHSIFFHLFYASHSLLRPEFPLYQIDNLFRLLYTAYLLQSQHHYYNNSV